MDGASLTAAVKRVQSLESEVMALRRTLDQEQLDVRDRDYLARCFDLLDMELAAVRQYLAGLS